jgi:hypothetical protein
LPRPGRAEDLETLAAKLGRPPTGLSAFRSLTPAQVGLLSDLIDGACERERAAVDAALGNRIPAPLRATVLRIMRGAGE